VRDDHAMPLSEASLACPGLACPTLPCPAARSFAAAEPMQATRRFGPPGRDVQKSITGGWRLDLPPLNP
jgi:hypothetical protein